MSLLLDALTKMREKGYQRQTFEMSELLAMYGEISVLEHERDVMDKRWFNIGIETASMKCIEWADSCCGGSGAGGEGYRNLGKLLLAMRK
jgi:hypothetical protein